MSYETVFKIGLWYARRMEIYNNTQAWVFQDRVYIDSMKYAHVFEKELASLCLKPSALDFQTHYIPKEKDILFGDRASEFWIAGRKTICHVYSFKIPNIIPSEE